MVKFTAVMERGEDGSWSASTLTPSIVTGTGASREAALTDLRLAIAFWLEFMKETGQPVPAVSAELVPFEVAA